MDSFMIYHEGPESLKTLCLNKLIRDYCGQNGPIPTEISELLAESFRKYALSNKIGQLECDRFFRYFKHKYMPLTRINFSDLPISEPLFIEFLEEYRHQLSEVNIIRCPFMGFLDLKLFNKLKHKDAEAEQDADDDNDYTTEKEVASCSSSSTSSASSSSSPPRSRRPVTLIVGERAKTEGPVERIFDDDLLIKKLVVHKVRPKSDLDEFCINQKLSQYLTPSMSSTLKYLDLSYSSIGKGSALMHLESLEILILYDCQVTYPDVISTICHLKKLRSLDISREIQDDDTQSAQEEYSNLLLSQVVTKLPHLTRLDISGTNYIGSKDRNISVFESRAERPFEFLGLLHTGNDAAYRSFIPALKIAGEATEEQILNACEAYLERPEQLKKALGDLYNLYKTITPSETFTSVNRALDVVLTILPLHISDQQIILFTTAILWCIVKINVTAKKLNDAKVRRNITSKLLDVMHYNKTNQVILINGGLTLLFLPDIICEHSRVASISLLMCQDEDMRTQGFGTTLLNTLACQVGGDQKVHIGELRAIEIMTEIIKSKIRQNTCDDILETAWSTLWNITDETPVNCSRFLQCEGFEAFEHCMDKFSNNKEVLRNIMGLLGNVAECQELRKEFMQARYIQRFVSLLSSPIDGIECSYNACGILAHLVSDGQDFWDKYLQGTVRRRDVTDQMVDAINKWPINSRRNINYRSFEPIVRLLSLDIAPAAQYWAVFALANLTRINPVKYCEMLIPFNGLDKLRCLSVDHHTTEEYVRNLAAVTLYQYDRFQREQTLAGLEQCDSVDLEKVKSFRAESSTSDNNGDGTSEMNEIML